MHASRVQIDAAVKFVLLLVEPHRGLRGRWMQWSPHQRRSPTLQRREPSGHRSFYLGTPPPTEAEAMMSIQLLQPTAGSSYY
jgi:hypothetical protein